MKRLLSIREIQLGLIILFSFYIFSYLAGLDLHMIYSHEMITYISLFFLIILFLVVKIMIDTPHRGLLRLISKTDTWFINSYNVMFFIIFFTLCTLICALLSYAVHMDRSQDIFTLGMLIANIYYMIIAFWVCYNFITMSAMGENIEFKR